MAGLGLLHQVTTTAQEPRRPLFPAVVITGASTGIGKACAIELDRRGFHVFAGVRTEAAAEQLRAEASPRLTPLLIDVTVADSIAAAAKKVAEATGDAGLAGLVNNAGIAVAGPIEAGADRRLPPPARSERDRPGRRHPGVSSAAAESARARGQHQFHQRRPGRALHGPLFGVEVRVWRRSTTPCALELRTWGIRVSAVEPGAIATPIWEKSVAMADQLARRRRSGGPLALRSRFGGHPQDWSTIRSARPRPVERVVKAVVHALTARRPKTHYYLGWDVRLCFKGMKMLPDRLRDWIVRKLIGLR